MSKKALMVLADGFEETEAIVPIDILRRANVELTVAGLSGREITSARGVKVLTDKPFEDVKEEYDAIAFPGGGGGAENLSKSERVNKLIKEMHDKGKIVAAICASPAVVLAPTGILKGKRATCYPGMSFPSETSHTDAPVVVDGNIVTSKGPGTAALFGLKLAELLAGKDVSDTVRNRMLLG